MNATSENSSPEPPKAPSLAITLKVKNLGHVPSYKNKKRIVHRSFLATDKKTKAWMQKVSEDFASQLSCLFRTRGIEMPMGPQALSLIACWIPLDDSLKWIAPLSVSWRRVRKGEEGAEISIEPNLPEV